MTRFVIALILLSALTGPAAAHKLKVFATVDGDAVTGYAFFVGGGRAKATPWIARDAGGTVIATGETDAEGAYRFVLPRPVTTDITVTVDTREGHVGRAVVAAARFGGAAPTAAAEPNTAATTTAGMPAASASGQAGTGSPTLTETEVAALVEAAVQRQVEPLLERIEQMDSRLRFTDILSGLFLIAGLAGLGLWARGRSGERPGERQ
ncbi:hypothetical protein [Polymorphum gilvum]|uniref:CbiL protein n=1 Tax=Polymorphum gilvum (strain LMG 25793 / CGMCC 1.9160 / SL003B-26A1) TaxID=991905 RepID=F2J365_POLGS|nr:hypothetical protein [Polymorphum gilvum]ADZ69872.1 CbiL protein [Polymorphum gilvum SL003B-26A1]